MTSPILVTGGTGTLGRLVVPRLHEAGYEVRVLSRHRHQDQDAIRYLSGDLATGEGIDAAVDGVGTIVHLAGSPKGDQVKAAQLVQAASRAGAAHLVFVSVVGADKIPVTSGIDRAMFGYFAAKWAAEQLIAGSGLPYTTLRATQFHSLTLLTVRQLARLPVIPVPAGWRFQPIDPGEVAERLVALALGRPAGLVPEVGGPRVYGLAELVRGYLEARGRYRPILPVWLPGGANRAFRAGANLAPERAVGRRSWEEFLADQVSQPSHSSSGPTWRPARNGGRRPRCVPPSPPEPGPSATQSSSPSRSRGTNVPRPMAARCWCWRRSGAIAPEVPRWR